MSNIYAFKSDSPLSNFYPCEMLYDNISFTSSEAAYQSHKTTDRTLWAQFSKVTPAEAKRLGRSLKLRSDWEQVKISLMYDVLLAKFQQCEAFRDALFATGTALIVEDTTGWHDNIWGVCYCEACRAKGIGDNLLGQTLTILRNNLMINNMA